MSDLVGQGSKYTDDHRRQAVLEYSIYGSLTKVSESMNIPRQTLSSWKRCDWWVQVESEVQHEKERFILAQHTEIVTKASEVITDRLEFGDFRLVKVGDGYESRRVPISGRDAALIGGISFDKRRLILNQPTKITGSSKDMTALLEQFEKLARESREKVVSEQ